MKNDELSNNSNRKNPVLKIVLSIVAIQLLIFIIAVTVTISACRDAFVPKKMGEPLGMYLYNGATKTLLNGSGEQIVKQVEYEGLLYDIIITDHYYTEDYYYFCAEFCNNDYIGLFRYSFADKNASSIYVKNVSDKTAHVQFEIYHRTSYFIVLQECELDSEGYCGEYVFGKHEYYAIDFSGNIVDTGFDISERYNDTVAYTDSFRLAREYNGNETVFSIEHLITHEKTTLGTAPGYIAGYYLYYNETDKLFCFITQNEVNNVYRKYLAVYDKETKTLFTELWDVAGDAYIIDINRGLFYFNKSIYQLQNDGLVAIHVSDYNLSDCQVLHNGIIVFSATDGNGLREDYLYDSATNERVFGTEQHDYYGYRQYYFGGYVFYVTERHQMMWTTHYYLHRVNLKTKTDEIVRYSINEEITFDRIDF